MYEMITTPPHHHAYIKQEKKQYWQRLRGIEARTETDNCFFNKRMSVSMAGISVLLMVFIHLFTYPHWLMHGSEWIPFWGEYGKFIIDVICAFGGICVYVFAFISGYSLVVSTQSYTSFRKRSQRLTRFLCSYWMILGLFLLLGLLMGDNLPSMNELVCNSVGLDTGVDKPWVNVPFAWYVAFYIEFIIVSPGLMRIFGGENVLSDILSVFCIVIIVYVARIYTCGGLIGLLSQTVFPFLSVCTGVLFAKYDLLTKIHNRVTDKLHMSVILLIIAAIVLTPLLVNNLNPLGGKNWSFFMMLLKTCLAPFFILITVELLCKINDSWLYKCIYQIGLVSMYLWFLHGIFFTGSRTLQPYLYAVKEPMLIFTLCIIILLPIAFAFKTINSYIFRFIK